MSGNQTDFSNEDIIKKKITEFLTAYKAATTISSSQADYEKVLTGGVLNGQTLVGFIPLKQQVLQLMKQAPDTSCVTQDYINNQKNNIS